MSARTDVAAPLLAWAVSDGEWTMVVLETTRARARLLGARTYAEEENFLHLSCKRAPRFDDMAAQAPEPMTVDDMSAYNERGYHLCANCERWVVMDEPHALRDGDILCEECGQP